MIKYIVLSLGLIPFTCLSSEKKTANMSKMPENVCTIINNAANNLIFYTSDDKGDPTHANLPSQQSALKLIKDDDSIFVRSSDHCKGTIILTEDMKRKNLIITPALIYSVDNVILGVLLSKDYKNNLLILEPETDSK